MENSEELLQILDRYIRLKQKDIPKEFEEYFGYVARTGDIVFKWSNVKHLFREKLLNVIKNFNEDSPRLEELPNYPNVDPFNYEAMKSSLVERLDLFTSAPFTIQRLSELLIEPRKQYTRIDKFMRALEKTILVVSTVDPSRKRSESENGDSLDSANNGDVSLEVNIDIEMDNDVLLNNGEERTPLKANCPRSGDDISEPKPKKARVTYTDENGVDVDQASSQADVVDASDEVNDEGATPQIVKPSLVNDEEAIKVTKLDTEQMNKVLDAWEKSLADEQQIFPKIDDDKNVLKLSEEKKMEEVVEEAEKPTPAVDDKDEEKNEEVPAIIKISEEIASPSPERNEEEKNEDGDGNKANDLQAEGEKSAELENDNAEKNKVADKGLEDNKQEVKTEVAEDNSKVNVKETEELELFKSATDNKTVDAKDVVEAATKDIEPEVSETNPTTKIEATKTEKATSDVKVDKDEDDDKSVIEAYVAAAVEAKLIELAAGIAPVQEPVPIETDEPQTVDTVVQASVVTITASANADPITTPDITTAIINDQPMDEEQQASPTILEEVVMAELAKDEPAGMEVDDASQEAMDQ